MAWTNKAVQSVFTKYGDRVNSISLNNGKYLFLNYPSKQCSVDVKDIKFETIEGNDIMIVPQVDISSGKPMKFSSYVTTEFIEQIDILDEEFKNKRIDPFILMG